jgi:uncharacterized protein (TIGR03790 family)
MAEALPHIRERVLVVRNVSSGAGRAVAQHYLQRRGLDRVLDVNLPDAAAETRWETVPYGMFRDRLQVPVTSWLQEHPEVDYVVLTKGIPLRVDGCPGLGWKNRQPSVDSALAASGYEALRGSMRLRVGGRNGAGTAFLNRYFDGTTPFVHRIYGGWAVCRLDGYTAGDAMELVNRALEAEKSPPKGAFLFDCDPSRKFEARPGELLHRSYESLNLQMCEAACELALRHLPVELNTDAEFRVPEKPLAGYFGWGSNDRRWTAEKYGRIRFAPGGIAATAVSTSARTMLPTRGGQSLIADLVQQGVTGVHGCTDEPLIDGIASPNILFHRFTSGFNLADSFWAAIRFAGWQDVVLGDPLCSPWRPAASQRA